MPIQIVILRWRTYVEIVESFEGDDLDLGWIYRLADEDSRLLRAIVCEPKVLEDDDDWGGPSMFVRDVICFHGYADYPSYWYKEAPKAASPEEPESKPSKKAKKK